MKFRSARLPSLALLSWIAAVGCGPTPAPLEPAETPTEFPKLSLPAASDARLIGTSQIPAGYFNLAQVTTYLERSYGKAHISHRLQSPGMPRSNDILTRQIDLSTSPSSIQATSYIPLSIKSASTGAALLRRRAYWTHIKDDSALSWSAGSMLEQGSSLIQLLNSVRSGGLYIQTNATRTERAAILMGTSDKFSILFEVKNGSNVDLVELLYERGSEFQSPMLSNSHRIVMPVSTDTSVVKPSELSTGTYLIHQIRSHFISQEHRFEGYFEHLVANLGQPAPADTINKIFDWGNTSFSSIESHLNLPLELKKEPTDPALMAQKRRHFWEKLTQSNQFSWSSNEMTQESFVGDSFMRVFEEGTLSGRGLYTYINNSQIVSRSMLKRVSETEFKVYFQLDSSNTMALTATFELTYKAAP